MTFSPSDIAADDSFVLEPRALLATLRRYWWIVPTTLAVSTTIFWTQETDLKTQPSSYLITKTFEYRDVTAPLSAVGLDPSAVRPFPDVNNQIVLLQSSATASRLRTQTGLDASVSVSRSQPTFSLVDTLSSNGKSRFTFESSGSPTYLFSCSEEVRADCELMISAYVDEFQSLQRKALSDGMRVLRSILTATLVATGDATLSLKIAAIDAALNASPEPLVLISSFEQSQGPTLVSVRRPTYLFAAGAGLFIAFLILLQLNFIDRRIRTVRQLTKLIPGQFLLGVTSNRPQTAKDLQTAVSVATTCIARNKTHVVCYSLSSITNSLPFLDSLGRNSGFPTSSGKTLSELHVGAIISVPTSEASVLVVQRDVDHRTDILPIFQAMRQMPHDAFIGVILID